MGDRLFPRTTAEANSVLVINPTVTGKVSTSSSELAMVNESENHLYVSLHDVRCASVANRGAIRKMGVEHGDAHVLTSQEFLDCADGLPVFKLVGR
jgi:hypothetical protein